MKGRNLIMKKAISFFILILLLLTAGTPFAVSAENDSADLTIERIVLTSPDTLYVIFSEPVNIVDRNDIAFFGDGTAQQANPDLSMITLISRQNAPSKP